MQDLIAIELMTCKPIDLDCIEDLPSGEIFMKPQMLDEFAFTELFGESQIENARTNLCCVDFNQSYPDWFVMIDDMDNGTEYLIYTSGYQYIRYAIRIEDKSERVIRIS